MKFSYYKKNFGLYSNKIGMWLEEPYSHESYYLKEVDEDELNQIVDEIKSLDGISDVKIRFDVSWLEVEFTNKNISKKDFKDIENKINKILSPHDAVAHFDKERVNFSASDYKNYESKFDEMNPRGVDFNLYSFIDENEFKSLLRDLNMYSFIFNTLVNKNKVGYKFIKGKDGYDYSHIDLTKNWYTVRFYFIYDYLVIDIINPKSFVEKSYLNSDSFEICNYLENFKYEFLRDKLYSLGFKDNSDQAEEYDFSLPCRIRFKSKNFSKRKF